MSLFCALVEDLSEVSYQGEEAYVLAHGVPANGSDILGDDTFQSPGGVTVPAPSAQKSAISVRSSVRLDPTAAPNPFTSL
jgi:hypothetical protein